MHPKKNNGPGENNDYDGDVESTNTSVLQSEERQREAFETDEHHSGVDPDHASNLVKERFLEQGKCDEIFAEKPSKTRVLCEQKSQIENEFNLFYSCIEKTADLFNTPDGKTMIQYAIGGRREIKPAKIGNIVQFIDAKIYETFGAEISSKNATKIAQSLTRKHFINGATTPVYTRFAQLENTFYLDLCNENNEVVIIDENGWHIDTDCKIKFIKFPHMRPLPRPSKGGNYLQLFNVANLADPNDIPLLATWPFTCFFKTTSQYVLTIVGHKGSAKSTTASLIKKLLDNSEADKLALPSDKRSLIASLFQYEIVLFDNLTDVNKEQETIFCINATKGSHADRQLYSNLDLSHVKLNKSIITTSIKLPFKQPDTIDRILLIETASMAPSNRIEEQSLWKAFDEYHPHFLGGFLDAFVEMLRELKKGFEFIAPPRMMDAAKIQILAAKVLGFDIADVEKQIALNNFKANHSAVATSPDLEHFYCYVLESNGFTGKTCTEIRKGLIDLAHRKQLPPETVIPGNEASLSRRIKDWEPLLKAMGWVVSRNTLDGYTPWSV